MAIFGYMALTMTMGLFLLSSVAGSVPTFILRKGFHLLAFVLFLPPIAYSKYDKPRLIVFAFNCVTVALILLEILRFGGHLPQAFSDWFKDMSSGRERDADTVIATHIWLLMGCAFPL
jgi:dolichol kinase